jgi:putative ABC transport system substrate-binding protein
MTIGRAALAAGLALSILTAPIVVHTQQPPGKTAHIGYLSFRSGPSHAEEAFRQGLRELGYVEGQNLSIEFRWAGWKSDRASAQAAELARLKLDVIVSTGGNVMALAAKKAVKTIPVVFIAGDPMGAGIVSGLARPGGNLTGINLLVIELNTKRLEILKEAVPMVSRVAVLRDPTRPTNVVVSKDLERAAAALRLKLQMHDAREPQQIDDAFAEMTRGRAGAVLVVSDVMFTAQHGRIVDLAARHRLPGIFVWREFVEAGGLMSYGPSRADMYRHLASYVDKILRGAKPGDLPVEQPTKFELVINMKTAKALGLTIPPSLLLRADQVIE